MTTRSLLWGSLAVVLLATVAAAQQTAGDSDEQAVLAAEHQWVKSQQANNVEQLGTLLADKIVATSEDGEVLSGKDAVLADAKTDQWKTVDVKDVKVIVYGHTAIANGIWMGKGTSGGKPVDAHVRFTDIWMKQANGKWLCVATQDSPIKT